MSEFKVQVQNLFGAMDSTEQLESILQQAKNSVISVKRNLRAQIRQRERIDSRLTAIAEQLGTQRQSVGRAVSTGRQIAGFYQETEQMLLGLKTGATPPMNESGKGDKTPFAPKDLLSSKNLWKLIGQAGIVGQISKAVASFPTGDAFGTAKDIVKIVGTGAKLADGPVDANWWKSLLGWKAPSKSGSAPVGFGDHLAKGLEKYKISGTQSTGKNVAAAAKWAGDLITVAETGVSNWDEFKNDGGWSNPRLYGETVIESGLKIGSGMAISAAVGSTAVAVLGCTPVGWAAVGVGVATVAVTATANWVLDGISGLITGNSNGWVENVSDGIIDFGKSVGSAAKKAANGVAKWWKGLFH